MRMMIKFLQAFILAGLAIICLSSKPLPAQPLDSALPQVRLNTIFPAGAKAGSTVEISFTGTDLDELEGVVFSHPGFKVEPILEEIKKEDPKKAAAKKDDKAPVKKPNVIKFKITTPADAPLGLHDLRLVGKWGISNPRAFHVFNLNEVLEKEPNNDLPEAQKIDLETVVNGIISAPTDVDYFQVDAKKGQRVLVACLASSIDSKCNPLVEVYDQEGRMLANNKNYDSNDALADYIPAQNMTLVIRVSQFTYNQGSPDHFYRLMVGTFPWVDAVYPNAVETGKSSPVTYYGRNLPGGVLDPTMVADGVVLEKSTGNITPPANSPVPFSKFYSRITPPLIWFEGFEQRISNKGGVSNAVFVGNSDSAVVLEKEDNDTIAKAQKIPFPVALCGKIDKRGDKDWYQIQAKKGERIIVRVMAETLGSQADIFVRVVGKDGKSVITELDDRQDTKNAKFYSGSTDPGNYILEIPDDGEYSFFVGSRQSGNLYGPRHHYQLKLSAPSGKFQMVVMPAANFRPDVISIPKGGSTYLSLFAFREDGLKGDIEVKVDGLPQGCKAQPLLIPANQDKGLLVIDGGDNAQGNSNLKITATSVVNGKTISREPVPVGIVWGMTANQNIVAISRVDRGMVAEVDGKAPFLLKGSLDKLKLTQGDKGTIKVQVTRNEPEMKNPIQVQAFDLPANFVNNNQAISIAANVNEVTVPVTVPATLSPGPYLIVLRGQTNIAFAKDPAGKQKAQVNVVAVANPMELLVLPKTLGEFSATNSGVQVKIGQEGSLALKVKRLHDYTGSYKVEAVLPMNTKGLVLEASEIPGGSDAGSIKVKVAPDAMVGPRNDIVLRFKGMFRSKEEIAQEIKVNVSVVK